MTFDVIKAVIPRHRRGLDRVIPCPPGHLFWSSISSASTTKTFGKAFRPDPARRDFGAVVDLLFAVVHFSSACFQRIPRRRRFHHRRRWSPSCPAMVIGGAGLSPSERAVQSGIGARCHHRAASCCVDCWPILSRDTTMRPNFFVPMYSRHRRDPVPPPWSRACRLGANPSSARCCSALTSARQRNFPFGWRCRPWSAAFAYEATEPRRVHRRSKRAIAIGFCGVVRVRLVRGQDVLG